MRHRKRRAEEVFRHEVPIGHRVQRVLRNGVKAQHFARYFAVDGVGSPRERRAAQRHDVHALSERRKSVKIAQEHLRIRVEVLRAVDGLRLSQMRKSGHDIFDGLLRAGEQSGDDRLQRLDRAVGGSAGIQAEIGRDLVVARARRVQLLAHLPDARNQLVLDEGVDVLLSLDGEFARFDVRIDTL